MRIACIPANLDIEIVSLLNETVDLLRSFNNIEFCRGTKVVVNFFEVLLEVPDVNPVCFAVSNDDSCIQLNAIILIRLELKLLRITSERSDSL